jgi:hypothetical protein
VLSTEQSKKDLKDSPLTESCSNDSAFLPTKDCSKKNRRQVKFRNPGHDSHHSFHIRHGKRSLSDFKKRTADYIFKKHRHPHHFEKHPHLDKCKFKWCEDGYCVTWKGLDKSCANLIIFTASA